ncbi:developmental regulator protein [Rutstroemia sp. NJR-2017a WRK4]|nr:developmental regulator protein [Rutstroemia sp. NJR-2017a WRK4]
MPTYLLHGFRWHRSNIMVHIVINDLEDAAPEWVMAPATSNALLNSFYTLYDFLPPSNPPPIDYSPEPSPTEEAHPTVAEKPAHRTLTNRNTNSRSRSSSLGGSFALRNSISNGQRRDSVLESEAAMSRTTSGGTHQNTQQSRTGKEKGPSFNEWSVVKLVEQYNPDDMSTKSQPWAYVADHMVEVTLGVSIAEEMKRYEDKLKAEEEIPDGPENGGISAREARRKSRRVGWFEKLREGLQSDESAGWHVVFCGDEERWFPPAEELDEINSQDDEEDSPVVPRDTGLRGFFKRRMTQGDEIRER